MTMCLIRNNFSSWQKNTNSRFGGGMESTRLLMRQNCTCTLYVHSFFFVAPYAIFASDLSSFFSLVLFDLAGDEEDPLTDVALPLAALLCVAGSLVLDPQRAHCSNWRINGAMPSSMLTLARTRNGNTPAYNTTPRNNTKRQQRQILLTSGFN